MAEDSFEIPKDSELELLREIVKNAKIEVSAKFEDIRNRVNSLESDIFHDLDNFHDHYEKLITSRSRSISQLEVAKMRLYTSLTQNDLASALEKMLVTINSERKVHEEDAIEIPNIFIAWDDISFENALNNLCKINEIKYTAEFYKSKPFWCVSERGSGNDELNHPRGIANDAETNNIYVADCLNDRIQVFSEQGKYINAICKDKIKLPRRIRVSEEFLFITSDLHFLNKVNKKTNDVIEVIEFQCMISGIDEYKNKYIYVCDLMSFQVIVLRIANFKLKRKFTLKATGNSETQTRDIRVEATVIYVLFHKSQFPLQSFTQEGVLLRHIVTDTMVVEAKYFCLDASSNLLISDSGSHQIRVFSPQGDLVQVVGKKGKDNPGELFEPQGVAVNYVGDVFVVDRKVVYSLQAF